MPAEASFGTGILVVLVGAFANGSFGLMLKYAKSWKWEHLWLTYSVFAMLIIPWTLGFATVPELLTVLRSASTRDLSVVFVFGFGWGIGAVLYGLALKLVGMALSYSIVVGLTAAIGSLAPLVLVHPQEVFTLRGRVIISGVLMIVVGVVFCAWAGHLKEKVLASTSVGAHPSSERENFPLGLGVVVLSGILSPMLNLSFAYGTPLTRLAVGHGTDPLFAANIIWVVALLGGFLVNTGYCAYLISSGGSWALMSIERFHYLLGLIMGVLWSAGIVFYGIGASKLGDLAAVVGWPVMSSMAIMSANLWGAIAGEWADTGRKPRIVMWLSVVVLGAAMFVVGWGDRLGR